MLNLLTKLTSPLEYASLHLTFFPRVGPLPVNKRKSLANYHRQSRTAAEPSWEEFPSLSRAGTVGGFLPRPFIYTISPSGLPEVEVDKGCHYLLGALLYWEDFWMGGITAVASFLLEAEAFRPGCATPPPTLLRISGPSSLESLVAPQQHLGLMVCWKGKGWFFCLDPSRLTHRKC